MKNVLLMTSILILTFSGACRSKPNCWILQPWRFDATPPRSQLESASGGLPESPAVVSSSLTWWSSWIGQRSYRTWCYPYCQLDPWKNHLMEQSRICRLLFSCIGPASFSTLSLSNFLFLFCFCFFFCSSKYRAQMNKTHYEFNQQRMPISFSCGHPNFHGLPSCSLGEEGKRSLCQNTVPDWKPVTQMVLSFFPQPFI